MAELLLNWVTDRFANTDIIDLYFIITDLVDIPITEAGLYESAQFDSFATHAAESSQTGDLGVIPIGKLVL